MASGNSREKLGRSVVARHFYAPNRHDTGSTSPRPVGEVALIWDPLSHYSPLIIEMTSGGSKSSHPGQAVRSEIAANHKFRCGADLKTGQRGLLFLDKGQRVFANETILPDGEVEAGAPISERDRA